MILIKDNIVVKIKLTDKNIFLICFIKINVSIFAS